MDNLFDYLIPIAIMVLYFVLNARKKKEPPQVQRKEAVEQPPSFRRVPPSAPPVVRTPAKQWQRAPSLEIENRKIGSPVKESRFSAAMTEKRRSDVARRKQPAAQTSHIHKKRLGGSHARTLLKRTSLRDAFLLKEILNRPFD